MKSLEKDRRRLKETLRILIEGFRNLNFLLSLNRVYVNTLFYYEFPKVELNASYFDLSLAAFSTFCKLFSDLGRRFDAEISFSQVRFHISKLL